MNFQEFLSNEETRAPFSRESAEAKIPRRRASYPYEGLCDRMPCERYRRLGNAGFEAVLVDSEALDL